MLRLTRTLFFLTVLLGLLTSIRAGESARRPPTDVSHPVVTEVVEPQRRVVHRLAIPDSAPAFGDDEPEVAVAPTPPPPIPFASFDSSTVRGQSSVSLNHFNERPSPPEGPIDDPSVISEKLMGEPKTADAEEVTTAPAASGQTKTAQLANGMLLLVTVCALGLLVYAIAIAWDYRQRWMQALTTQNSRLASAFDDGTLAFSYSDDADLYGTRRFDPMEI